MELPSSISHRQRTALRLILAVAASIAVHAAAMGFYAPEAPGKPAAVAHHPALQAVLAPAQSQAPAALPEDSGAARAPEPAGAGAGGRDGLPVPDHWFRRSELDRVAAPTTMVKLDYPESARSLAGVQVQVRLYIDERGLVRKVTVEERGPETAFDEAAVKAWQAVRFSPAMKDGLAVKSQQVIEVDFQPAIALR